MPHTQALEAALLEQGTIDCARRKLAIELGFELRGRHVTMTATQIVCATRAGNHAVQQQHAATHTPQQSSVIASTNVSTSFSVSLGVHVSATCGRHARNTA